MPDDCRRGCCGTRRISSSGAAYSVLATSDRYSIHGHGLIYPCHCASGCSFALVLQSSSNSTHCHSISLAINNVANFVVGHETSPPHLFNVLLRFRPKLSHILPPRVRLHCLPALESCEYPQAYIVVQAPKKPTIAGDLKWVP